MYGIIFWCYFSEIKLYQIVLIQLENSPKNRAQSRFAIENPRQVQYKKKSYGLSTFIGLRAKFLTDLNKTKMRAVTCETI